MQLAWPMRVAATLRRCQHVLEHSIVAGTKTLKVAPIFTQRHVVRAGIFIRAVHIPAVVFPKADAADTVLATVIPREVIAARALIKRHGLPFMNS